MNYELEGKELATLVKEWQSSIDLLAEILEIPICAIVKKDVAHIELLAANKGAKEFSFIVGSHLEYAKTKAGDCKPIPPAKVIENEQYLPIPSPFTSCRYTAINHSNGSIFGYLCLADVTSIKLSRINQSLVNQVKVFIEKILIISENNKKFKYLSERDSLTALYNRRAFFKHALEEQERCIRLNQELALLYIDLDFFKEFNDQYGHEAGDQLLVAVAECMTMKMRRYDILARFGGEEFVVLLSSISVEGATKRAESLRKAIEQIKLGFALKDVKVTASIGVTMLNGGENIDQAICRADDGLYSAKQGGRNVVKVVPSDRIQILEKEPAKS